MHSIAPTLTPTPAPAPSADPSWTRTHPKPGSQEQAG
ncbi:hypothetical protein SRB17_22580 [Streptomyces sp. RB17]|nr:hypothetical protein [Streptomyces sp. RB17]